MIRNRSVSHVHIHASIIFTSIITNSVHFCTSHFTCNCLPPISKSLLMVQSAWVTLCLISSHLPRNYEIILCSFGGTPLSATRVTLKTRSCGDTLQPTKLWHKVVYKCVSPALLVPLLGQQYLTFRPLLYNTLSVSLFFTLFYFEVS